MRNYIYLYKLYHSRNYSLDTSFEFKELNTCGSGWLEICDLLQDLLQGDFDNNVSGDGHNVGDGNDEIDNSHNNITY